MEYRPDPINTDDVQLPDEILALAELLAENAHAVWAEARMRDGWKCGARRSDERKEHPCLVPYALLPEAEKQYDRNAALTTLKLIRSLGYNIAKTDARSFNEEREE